MIASLQTLAYTSDRSDPDPKRKISVVPDLGVQAGRRRVQLAKRICADRRERDQAFGRLASVFRDPAWDIALDLFVAAEERRSVSVSSASIASHAPMTTGLRCVDRLVDSGVVVRSGDPTDARRSLVTLTEEARACMEAYLDGAR